MGMLPCPHACALGALGKCSVGSFLGIYQSYIAVIDLGGFIYHIEDTLSTCQCGED